MQVEISIYVGMYVCAGRDRAVQGQEVVCVIHEHSHTHIHAGRDRAVQGQEDSRQARDD